MRKKKWAKFKKLFECEIKEKNDALMKLKGDQENHHSSDELDQAQVDFQLHLNAQFKNRTQIRINQLKKALERISAGQFGVCESCGIEIEKKRLEINPIAVSCVQCLEEEERQNKVATYAY